MSELTLGIAGMKCDGCADAVREALRGVDGVQQVEVSVDRGAARIRAGDGVAEDDLATAVEGAGYRVEKPA